MSLQTDLHAGLADPVFDAQRVFRAVLDAMARPGRIVELPAVAQSVGGCPAEPLAVLLALADNTTPVWLPAPLRGGELGTHLAFHAAAGLTETPARAAFAVLDATATAEDVDGFAIGTPEYPDRSTTVILPCETLDNAGGGWRLAGPGIETTSSLRAAPVPSALERALRRNAALFPLGLDVILTAPGRVASIPRSTGLED